MPDTVIATLPAFMREHLQGRLPDWLQPRWFHNAEEALALAPGAPICWLDQRKPDMAAAIARADAVQWLNSVYAGVDGIPLADLQRRGAVLTNGAGLSSVTIAEYVVMGMLTIAKGWREVVRAQDRHEWLRRVPGRQELAGTRALVLGAGTIGRRVAALLAPFEVEVSLVRRHPGSSAGLDADSGAGSGGGAEQPTLGPADWRPRLGQFDWIILAVPATEETNGLIGAAELAAMKPTAVLLNVARGKVIDQPALVQALTERRIGGAFLDVTDPEPLPADHPLWSLDNAHISMHLSGQSQTQSFPRAAQRFIDNLARWRAGQPLQHQVDLALGY